MFSAALSALGIYFCQSCAQALSCLFWVKHEFCNSLERRQLDKGNRRSSDRLDGEQQADRKQERERDAKGKSGLERAQKQKNDKDTGYEIQKDSPVFR